MSHILLIGKSHSYTLTYLAEHGHDFTILQDRAETNITNKYSKNHVVVDFSNKTNILNAVDTINYNYPIDATFVIYEKYIRTAALISQHLGLPGMNENAAQACTDKEIMRSLFQKVQEKISPNFSVINSISQLKQFAKSYGFPLIIKPANLTKSLLVTKSMNLAELLDNYNKTMKVVDSIYARYSPHQAPKLLVEEYLDGTIHSVEAFVDERGYPNILEQVVDYQTGYDIGYEDSFHYSRILPSSLRKHEIDAIRHIADVGCRALGMTSSPAHIEIIYTLEGPRIVEIGARNGGYRNQMHMLANGIDIIGNAIALSLNKPLDLTRKRNDYVGVFEIFPKSTGLFKEILNINKLKSLASFNNISVKAKHGDIVGKAQDGYKMCAVVTLHSNNYVVFKDDVSYLTNYVLVQTNH